MKQVGYKHIAIVLETWDCAHFGSKKFDKEFGMVALERLFELQPRAKKVFGYNQGDEVGKSHANVHATAFAGLFDSVFQMLGPDLEFIQDIFCQALIYAIEKYLDKKLTEEQRLAWEEVYDSISHEIAKNILQ